MKVEGAGFTDVKTVLSIGNVVFNARAAARAALERRAEAAMEQQLGRCFSTLVRSVDVLRELLAADLYAAHRLPPEAKRVVSFLRTPPEAKLALPIEVDGARILAIDGMEVFTAYAISVMNTGPRGFGTEKTFGNGLTTRTWPTVRKCAAA